jgi:23S rRNA pseudouridine955/2504/2580 synthase
MTLVYEDEVLLVVDKPAGLPTQVPRGGGDNLFDRLRADRPYVGLHHRLDTAASGLVLFTLDRQVNAAIADCFREHAIDRRYRAILSGWVEAGAWERPVEGRDARTEVEVCGRRSGRTAVELTLRTGRHHQIRVHAALAGAPVLGDRRYGDEAAKAFPRLALHAAHLGLLHPRSRLPLEWSAPLPPPLDEVWTGITGGR